MTLYRGQSVTGEILHYAHDSLRPANLSRQLTRCACNQTYPRIGKTDVGIGRTKHCRYEVGGRRIAQEYFGKVSFPALILPSCGLASTNRHSECPHEHHRREDVGRHCFITPPPARMVQRLIAELSGLAIGRTGSRVDGGRRRRLRRQDGAIDGRFQHHAASGPQPGATER